jgi:hypothetical protein
MAQTIEAVPLLVRREIEARIIAPFVDALAQQFPRRQVLDILRETVVRIAHEQAAALPDQIGENDLHAFEVVTQKWTEGGALELNVLEKQDMRYEFNVTRCRYAEMYRRLGIPELGQILSCSRDFAAGEGFNQNLKLTRSKTILGGDEHCDFRYKLESSDT